MEKNKNKKEKENILNQYTSTSVMLFKEEPEGPITEDVPSNRSEKCVEGERNRERGLRQ